MAELILVKLGCLNDVGGEAGLLDVNLDLSANTSRLGMV
jgi:hypothetical protein